LTMLAYTARPALHSYWRMGLRPGLAHRISWRRPYCYRGATHSQSPFKSSCRTILGVSALGTVCCGSSMLFNEEVSPEIDAATHGTPLRRYRLCAFDLDGTLLASNSQISPFTMDLLHAIFNQGGPIIVIATGRVFFKVPLESLPGRPVYVISLNGAQVSAWHPPDGVEPGWLEDIAATRLMQSEAEAVLSLTGAEVCDAVWCTTGGDKYYVVAHSEFGRRFSLQENSHLESVADLPSLSALFAEQCPLEFSIVVQNPTKWIEMARRDLPPDMTRGPHALEIIDYSPRPLVGIQSAGIHKGSALQSICEKLGVPVGETVAFGDGNNDIELLQTSGLGIAPSNANAAAKSAAHRVSVFSNDEDSVARELMALQNVGSFINSPRT